MTHHLQDDVRALGQSQQQHGDGGAALLRNSVFSVNLPWPRDTA